MNDGRVLWNGPNQHNGTKRTLAMIYMLPSIFTHTMTCGRKTVIRHTTPAVPLSRTKHTHHKTMKVKQITHHLK